MIPNKKRGQLLRDKATGFALLAPLRIARILPYKWRLPFLGWLTARVISPLAGYTKRIRANLAHVLPDLPESDIQNLIRRVPDNAGRNMAELFSTAQFTARARRAPINGPGLKALHAARAKGRPVIIVSAHFGSFNAVRVALINQGFDMAVFYRPMHNATFNAPYTKAMAALSEPMFKQGRAGTAQMIKHLRAGGILAILADIKASDGVPLSFFGKPALTPLTAAELALKFDALLLPVWGIRAENGVDFDIWAEAPIAPSDAVTMTQDINTLLEAQIRAHMDQWFWIHRRWKDGTGPLAERGAKQLAARRKN
ncbi:Lipid A biosynthesis lauroyl acyltransferase [hydrothermal vent metagenome]|uniref:Lipid A biosynthesis lauroyl acyltransferase n=1 Tax=hydrothermal vent metagenome TaxID=652676 RepID=A0A3B0R8V1_9ZZZZ